MVMSWEIFVVMFSELLTLGKTIVVRSSERSIGGEEGGSLRESCTSGYVELMAGRCSDRTIGEEEESSVDKTDVSQRSRLQRTE